MIVDKPTAARGKSVEAPPMENPPPYADLQREATTSSAASGSTSTSASRHPSRPSVPAPQRSVSSGNSILNPATTQYVNRFTLFSKRDPISGIFVIDPSLERLEKLVRSRAPLNSRNKKYIGKKQIPHAVFGTKKSNIKLDLSIASAPVEARRSFIQAYSHSGTIQTALTPLLPNNHVCFEASTKDGNLIIFLPNNFNGGIQLRSHRASDAVHFLPEFATRARVIHGTDKESFVLFGNNNVAATDPKNTLVDLCLLTTHSGQITLGVTGLDHYEEPKPAVGLWQRIFGHGSTEKVDA